MTQENSNCSNARRSATRSSAMARRVVPGRRGLPPGRLQRPWGYKDGIPGLLEWLERRHASVEQSMHFLGNRLIEFLSETCAIAETYCVVYQRYGGQGRQTIRT
ncbi:nuclear transport factor 2 family protein [Variovorax paradoxus]|nr:nuclear transport factor 2 family protein [Variovorax paradoxus]